MRDVIVVGAGPAGSATAILLARQGFDVLLLDRARFPRDKPCGEFITSGCVPILQELGVWPALVRQGIHALGSAVLHSPSGLSATYSPPDGRPAGWSMRRTVFDSALGQHARESGAEVREGCNVRSVILDGRRVGGVEVGKGEAIRARLVIGADGSHSIIARQLGLVRPIRRLQRVAVVSHWSGIGGRAIEMWSTGDTVCGYGPLGPDTANVSMVVRTSDSSSLAGRATDFLMERIRSRFPDLADSLDGIAVEVRTIGCFGHSTSTAAVEGAMLVGDAACFIDPFTGEGIYFALRGAELAASVAAAALKAGDVSAARLQEYDSRRAELRSRYRLCDIVQATVRTPLLMNRVVSSLRRNPSAAHRLMSVLGDVKPPSDSLHPQFLADLLAPA